MGRPFLYALTALGLIAASTSASPLPPSPPPISTITRSDSIDILHTDIELDLRQTGNGLIAAHAAIRLAPRVEGITTLHFDLLALTVDSVLLNSAQLAFSQADEDLRIDLGGTYGSADTLTVHIHYHGDPVTDPSGFGGFYTLNTYQYDLGVAFDAVPHSFGRSWFPCFDNFVERCSFSYTVLTNGGRSAVANGLLEEETDLGGGEKRTRWRMDEPIPSYLASVAAANYATVRDTFISTTGASVPVTLVAHPQDTTDMKNSFLHLRNAFDTYERWFGPYRWDRVGYVLTSAGAMEHATNICYPDFAADGTLGDERLMAHELSHHWFGDLITCRRPEEMYINEGFADFCSYLFMEDLYGRPAYDDLVRRVHHDMVMKAHLNDDGWYALANVPSDVTYGDHSYKKGADIVHALRGYLGDSLFRVGFTRVLANDAYSDMSSEELRDSLIAATGRDLHDFFNDRVLQPGWATFEVDSFRTTAAGDVHPTTVFFEQKLRHADHYYQHVPTELTFLGADPGQRWTTTAELSGATCTVSAEPPFAPVNVLIDERQLLSMAVTTSVDTLTTTGPNNQVLSDIFLSVQALMQPVQVRIEEYWTAADAWTDAPFRYTVSPDRWWRVYGDLVQGTTINAQLMLDGRVGSGSETDPGLMLDQGTAFVEDSLVLLYRRDAHFPWAPLENVTISYIGQHTDRLARFTINGLMAGDYAVAWKSSAVGVEETATALDGWRYFPDPADDSVTIEAPAPVVRDGARLLVQDAKGRTLMEHRLNAERTRIDVSHLAAQTVVLTALHKDGTTRALGRLVIAH